MLEINLSTILLQMANFFLLAFILYRFLLKPLQNVLRKRDQEITRTMDEAQVTKEEAQELRRQYEEKNNNIDAEIAARKNEARIIIEQSRQQMLYEVQTQIEGLQTQSEEALSRLSAKALEQHQDKLGHLAAEYVRNILAGVITPDLESRYQQAFLDKVSALDLSRYTEGTPPGSVTFINVLTASQPSESFQEELSALILKNLGQKTQLTYQTDPDLIAGGVLRFENKLVDGSLRGQIENLQKRYQETA